MEIERGLTAMQELQQGSNIFNKFEKYFPLHYWSGKFG